MFDRANQSKRLTPKKYGFFTRSATMEGTNTAGEAMDDLLRAGGAANLDDSSQILDDDDSDLGDLALVSKPKGSSESSGIDLETRATTSNRESSTPATKTRGRKIQKPTAPVATWSSARHQEKVDRDKAKSKVRVVTKAQATRVAKAVTDAGGRAVRLRNWKGEVIKEGNGFVLVMTDEQSNEDYILY